MRQDRPTPDGGHDLDDDMVSRKGSIPRAMPVSVAEGSGGSRRAKGGWIESSQILRCRRRER